MPPTRKLSALTFGLSMAMASAVHAEEADAYDKNRHVLLLSIDGMHSVDFHNCVAANTRPNLAALTKTGVHYRRSSTSKPSDSYPGLMAIVTGGAPALVGAWYDVAYDRVLAPPAADTGNGVGRTPFLP